MKLLKVAYVLFWLFAFGSILSCSSAPKVEYKPDTELEQMVQEIQRKDRMYEDYLKSLNRLNNMCLETLIYRDPSELCTKVFRLMNDHMLRRAFYLNNYE